MKKRVADQDDLRAELTAIRRRVANLERSKARHLQLIHALKDLVFKNDDRAKAAHSLARAVFEARAIEVAESEARDEIKH